MSEISLSSALRNSIYLVIGTSFQLQSERRESSLKGNKIQEQVVLLEASNETEELSTIFLDQGL